MKKNTPKTRKQRNCHARSTQRLRDIKMRRQHKRTIDRRMQQISKAKIDKGITIHGRAKMYAKHISSLHPKVFHIYQMYKARGDASSYTPPKRSNKPNRLRKKNGRAARKLAKAA